MTNDNRRFRLVIVEDHHSVRELLVDAFTQLEDSEVVGQASSGRDAIAACAEHKPDVVLLDAMLPDMSGLDCVRSIRRSAPQAKILVFSGNTNPVLVSRAIALGVHGYVEKSIGFKDLVAAVRLVSQGGAYFGKAIKPTLNGIRNSPFPLDAAGHLTARENGVLAGIAMGKSSKVIAAELGLSIFTVHNHRRRIKAKTGLRTTADLTIYALNLGLVEEPHQGADAPKAETPKAEAATS